MANKDTDTISAGGSTTASGQETHVHAAALRVDEVNMMAAASPSSTAANSTPDPKLARIEIALSDIVFKVCVCVCVCVSVSVIVIVTVTVIVIVIVIVIV